MMLRWTCFVVISLALSGCIGDDADPDPVSNQNPEITSIAPEVDIEVGQEFQYDVDGNDVDNDTLSYSLCAEPPAGAVIDSDNGLLSWTTDTVGENSVCVQVDDGNGGIAQQSFIVSVIEPQTSAQTPILKLSQQSLSFGSNDTSRSFDLSNLGNGTLSWSATESSGWLSISPEEGDITSGTNSINVTVNRSNLVRGEYTGTINVASNGGNASVSVSMQAPNNVPKITSNIPVTSIGSGKTFKYNVTGSDADSDALSYSLCGTPPTGATMSDSGFLSWTAGMAGDVALCVQVSDGNGGAVQQKFTVTVTTTQEPSELQLSQQSLNFGAVDTTRTFTITNMGGGVLSWVLTRDEAWTSATPPVGSVEAGGSKTITVTVDRSGLANGTYTDKVNIAYNGKNKVVSVTIVVGDSGSDTEAPNNTTEDNFVNNGDSSVSGSSVILSLSATDNIGVTRTLIKDQKCSESAPADPAQSSDGWIDFVNHQSYNFMGSYSIGDEVCVYVWFKDAAGNISSVKSDGINLVASGGDSAAPYDVSLIINGGDTSTSSKTVTLNLSAKDDNGVTAYYVSENSAPPLLNDAAWISVASTETYSKDHSFTLSDGDGVKMVYGWFKDAADNLSNVANDAITYNEPSGGGGSNVFDVDLTLGNAGGGVRTGGDWDNGWRVTGNNQRIVFDAGRKIKNGYIETTFTINQNPWSANPTGNMSKNNFFGAYESSSLSHFEPGALVYMRQGKESYDFGVWKAGVGNLVDRLNDYEGFMEGKIGNSNDWKVDDTTVHTIKMTWNNGDVFYSGTGDGTQVVWHDVLRQGGYRVDDLQYGYIGLDKSYSDNRGVPGLRFKSFKMVDLDK